MVRITLTILACFFASSNSFAWGFFAHKLINKMAVFTLPPEMIGFYKSHIQYITENAVAPDKRRYTVEGEAPRHYIDLDLYGDSALYKLPKSWLKAREAFTEDSLMAKGIVPWHIYLMKLRLTEAFKNQDHQNIIKLSTEIGHYIADSHVPLHTTSNYNGQFSNQKGIHGFWESRLPELFSDDYDFFIGSARYLEDPQGSAWEGVSGAHAALDSVLAFEIELTRKFKPDKKFSFEERNGSTTKVYSKEFSAAYHQALKGQVERQMKASVKMIGDFWYTCWIDAGQPPLPLAMEDLLSQEEEVAGEGKSVPLNGHECH